MPIELQRFEGEMARMAAQMVHMEEELKRMANVGDEIRRSFELTLTGLEPEYYGWHLYLKERPKPRKNVFAEVFESIFTGHFLGERNELHTR